ncbi:DUF3987 domain-containing protein [Streptomyces sp. NPDC003328]
MVETEGQYEAMAYGAIGKEVLGVMPYTEASPIGVHAAILALFSAAVNGRVVQPGDRPTVVWTALAGRSSIGCKGTALEAAEWILAPALSDFLDVHRRQGISSGPSLINALYEQHEKSLVTEGGADGRLVVIEEEWQNQLRRTNRCPIFSGVFRSAWDGKMVSNTTKGKKAGEREEQRVDMPLLGFHSHIQPGAWSKYISDSEALGGSYNRILPVWVQRSKYLPTPEEGEGRPVYDYQPTKALKLAYEWARKEKRTMALNTAARKRFDELRMQYEEENAARPEVLSSFFERASEQVWRVAAILTAANRKTLITREAVEAARHFVDYSIASVTQLVNNSTTTHNRGINLALDERIRKALRSRGGEMTLSQLYRALGSGRFTAEEIQDECEGMPDIELETIRETKRAGSKPTIVRLVEVKEEEERPAQVREAASVPHPAEAEALLTLYAEWASKDENKGKSLSDFLTSHTNPPAPPAKKAAAKRSAAPRKAAATATSSTTPRQRGTASTPARKATAKKAASPRAAKKTAAAPAQS